MLNANRKQHSASSVLDSYDVPLHTGPGMHGLKRNSTPRIFIIHAEMRGSEEMSDSLLLALFSTCRE